jgi:hypothetical protein
MRLRLRLTMWAMFTVAAVWLAWYTGLFALARARLTWLAGQPAVATSFSDPGYGRVDALIMLLSFFLLAPLAAFLVLLALVFVLIVFVLLFEPILRLLRLPEWVAVPMVLAGSAAGAWASSNLWLPHSLHVLGLVARAWIVYFSTLPAFPR